MTPQDPQPDEIILAGFRFAVAGTTTDNAGRSTPIPGKCLGKANKKQLAKQNKPAGPRIAEPHKPTMAIAPIAEPSRTISPAVPSRPRKVRKPRHTKRRGDYHRFQKRPAKLVIRNEPWSVGNWIALVVFVAVVVGWIILSSVGSEQRKWESIERAAKAVQGR
jgi:hypothetical protein